MSLSRGTDSGASPVRVLVLLEQARPTGLVRQLVEALDRAATLGVTARVVAVVRAGADPGPLREALEQCGISCDIVPESGMWDPRPVGEIRRIIKSWRPDLVQTHGYKSASYAALLGAGGGGLPWLAFYHGRTTTSMRVRLYHLLERWIVGRATAIAPVAAGVESHFRKRDRARLSPIPNGVLPAPGATRSREQVRSDLGVGEQSVLVGFVGRLSQEKGPDLFLQTIAWLNGAGGDVCGVMAGDGPMRASLESALESPEIAGRVRLLGRIDNVRDLYEGLDVLLIASRSEVFPNVLLEAVEAGLPVAASPVGGIPDIAANVSTVIVAQEAEPESLATAVSKSLRSTAAERADARLTMRDRYSQERRTEALVALYHRTVGTTT